MGDLPWFCFSHVDLTCPFTSVFRVLRMLGDSVLVAPLVVVMAILKLLRLLLRLPHRLPHRRLRLRIPSNGSTRSSLIGGLRRDPIKTHE